MKTKKIERLISNAAIAVKAEIAAQVDQDNKFSVGLAYEGYQGGYLKALQDVMLVIGSNGDVSPNTRNYWGRK